MKIYDFRAVEAAGGFCRSEKPRFSWKVQSENKDTVQTKFTLTVLKDGVPVQQAEGESESQYVLPEGEPLAPRTSYEARLALCTELDRLWEEKVLPAYLDEFHGRMIQAGNGQAAADEKRRAEENRIREMSQYKMRDYIEERLEQWFDPDDD